MLRWDDDSKTKINQFDFEIIANKYIFKFYVSMHHTFFVAVTKCIS
jgi:hypothetical protein